MKVLIVKTSSMGDIIHTLPAVTDAAKANPALEFDWLVEEAFADIPKWHPAVNEVIPVAFRRLRKKGLLLIFNKEWRAFKRQLASKRYDLIIDAQGLLKSANLARFAQGPRVGFDKHSARESLASLFYQQKISVNNNLHSIAKLRHLFAKIFTYQFDEKNIDYGLATTHIPRPDLNLPKNYCVFVINTTWESKHWPVKYWRQLIAATQQQALVIPEGYAHEAEKVRAITEGFSNITLLSQVSLGQMLAVLANSTAVVSVDTGLSHLAAALAKPTITLYGPTDPQKIGTQGQHQIHLSAQFPCAPCEQKICQYKKPSEVKPACFTTISPDLVLQKLQPLLVKASDV
jgi:heptosyltransferase-1